jgi:riboflavin synthase
MFCGIVENVAKVLKIENKGDNSIFTIRFPREYPRLSLGHSVGINGVCLTVFEINEEKDTVKLELMPETLRLTSLAQINEGGFVNYEFALTPETPIGGHFVLGHVDTVGTIADISKDGEHSWIITVETTSEITDQLIYKGSISLDGISLTLSKVSNGTFQVSLIPHTMDITNLGKKKVGDKINIELDIITKAVYKYIREMVSDRKEPKNDQ